MYKVLLYVYSRQILSTEITCITNLDGKFCQFSLEHGLLFLVALCSWCRFVVLHGIIMLIGCVISNGTRHTDMAVTSYWCSLFLTYTHVTKINAALPNLYEQEQTFCVPRVYTTAPATATEAPGKTQHCEIQKLDSVVQALLPNKLEYHSSPVPSKCPSIIIH
jgi:hypothetical protein